MRRFLRPAVLIGVACAPVASALVLAQEQKVEAPAKRVQMRGGVMTTKQVVVEKKVEAPVKNLGMRGGVLTKKAVVVAKAKAIVVARPDVPFDQIQQFVQQFRPILRAEYHLIRSACELSKEQRTRIAMGGERALRDAATKFNEAQQKMMRGSVVYTDPRKLVQEGLATAAKPHLSAEQWARYQAEINKRAEAHKQVVVLNLVAKLDQDLVLSAEQRDKIAGSLASNWSDAWSQTLSMLQNGGHSVYPNIPNQHVVPFLEEGQRKVWAGLPKNQGGFWGGFGFGIGGMMEDDPLEDEDLRAARLAGREQGGKK